ncbi:MAG: NAD(P)-binding domain-containing protein, partial [Chloroflexi bacterium]|nr:NAD(P)-binding domain-containing protein [Chloroflexota bacterium]
LTFALLLAIARRVPEAADFARAGHWKTWGPLAFVGAEVSRATLGIVGLGRIGAAVARRARGFGMRILYHSRTRRPELEAELGVEWRAELGELLAESDFVRLHTPGGPATRHLMDAAALARMKPSAHVINVARGPVVDTAALLDALQRGVIAGAALDVTDPEPLPAENPLYRLSNCLIVPHIGSADLPTRTRMAMMAATNLTEALAGRLPPNCVNPEAYRGQ